MKRTFPTRAGLGGTAQRLETRKALRATARGALHKVNPPGAKLAKKVLKARGLPWRGEVFHTGLLTKLNNERSLNRLKRRLGIQPKGETE